MLKRMIAASLLTTMVGCSSLQGAAGKALEISADAVKVTDEMLAAEYTRAASNALHEANTITEYERLMNPWNDAVQVLVTAKGVLLQAQAALDVWIKSDDSSGFRDMASCLLAALAQLRDALEMVGLKVPAGLLKAIQLGGELDMGVCGG